eukprot:549580-Rhodomonas_salina.5
MTVVSEVTITCRSQLARQTRRKNAECWLMRGSSRSMISAAVAEDAPLTPASFVGMVDFPSQLLAWNLNRQ